jgi:uncharacterized protein
MTPKRKFVQRGDGSRYLTERKPVDINKREAWVYGKHVDSHDLIRGQQLVEAYASKLVRGDIATKELMQRVHNDGWLNALTGIGNPSFDKRHIANSVLTLDLLSQMDCEIIWRSDDMAAKAIEKIPDEMIRQGWDIQVEDDDDRAMGEEMVDWAEDFDLDGKAREAFEYARAYGGSGTFLGADDGQKDLTQPLDIDRIKTFQWANVLTPLELFPRIWYGDPHAPKYGEPMIYRIQRFVFGGAVETGFSEKIFEMPLVHESRIIRVDGIRVSRRHLRERNGWGDSVLMRALQVISDFQQAFAGTAVLVSDFAQAVFKIKDFADLISANDMGTLQARAQIIEMSRSVARALMIDKDEEFERKATPVAGLDKLLEQISLRLASTLDMPVTLLMGQSPAGLNATGDMDARWFYDRVKAMQKRKLGPYLKRALQLAFRAKKGPTGGHEPKKWTIQFYPLWQLRSDEEAKRRLAVAQADQVYIQSQVLSPEEVAASRFGGAQYDGDNTVIDLDSRSQIQKLDPEDPRPGPVDGVTRPPTPVPPGEVGTRDPGENAPAGSGGLGFRENPPNPGSTDGETT